MNQKKHGVIYSLVTLIFITFCIYYGFFISKLDSSAVRASNSNDINKTVSIKEGWVYHWGDSPTDGNSKFAWLDKNSSDEGWDKYDFPGRPKNPGSYNSIWIRTILPSGDWKQPTLRFRSPQQAVEVYLDGKLIYTFGKYDPDNKVRTPGSIWHLVLLPKDFAGKTVNFRLQTPFPQYTGYLIETGIGERSSHIVNIVKESGISVIFGFLFILTGLGLLLLHISGSRDWRFLGFLGLTSIFMGGWYIAESKILQLFFDVPVSMIYLANFFIFLAPVWLIIYVDNTFQNSSEVQRQLLRSLCYAHILLAALALGCDMAGFISVLNFNKFLHIMMPVTIITISYVIIKSTRGNRTNTVLFISGLIVLGITGIIDTFTMFYDNFPTLRLVKVSYLGMIFFLATLLVNAGRKLKNIYESLKSNTREIETNYKSLFTNMSECFTYCKLEFETGGSISKCIILEANESFILRTGIDKNEIIGADLYSIYPELKNVNIISCAADDEIAAAGESCYSDTPVRLGGKWYRISTFCPRKNYLSIILSDVTVMKNAEETIRRQAYTDSMTGFFNRRYFEDVMLKMHGKMHELKPLSIIVIDIDGLKITNDTFGHNVGDTLLKEVAGIISDVFKTNCVTTRIGGDEFCVIMPKTSYSDAQLKTDQIVETTEELNRHGPVVPISMSIGIATSSEEDHDDIYNIYRRADDDMYRYKISQSGSEKSKVIDMLLTALSERDYVSQGHVERLVELSHLMGDALNLHDVQKRNLVLLSKVHDLGKIGIPDEILNKPGRLTPMEYEKMKQHVKIGYNIASRSKELVTIAPLILHHHEQWNGDGYPDSLRGREIPLECRILAVIDAYDAMTNDRPYNKGISKEEAIKEIERCSESHFDPEIAKKFIEIVSKQPVFS